MDKRLLVAIIVLASIASIESIYIALTMQGLTDMLPGSDVVYDEYQEQLEANIKLIEDLNALELGYTALENDLDALQRSFDAIQAEKAEWDSVYGETLYNLTSLEEDYEDLQDEVDDLNMFYEGLRNSYEASQAAYDSLEDDMQSLQDEYQDYRDRYTAIMEEVNARAGQGALKGRFITPGDEAVTNAVQEVSWIMGDQKPLMQQWDDIQNLYKWVNSNIDYTYDSPHPILAEEATQSPVWVLDAYRYPNETLAEGRGDEEDQAVLLLSMMMTYNASSNYWCVVSDSDTSSRCAVAIIRPGRAALLDPVGSYYTGRDVGSFLDWPVEYAVFRWFDDWGDENMTVRCAFKGDTCIDFGSTQEFYDWVNGL